MTNQEFFDFDLWILLKDLKGILRDVNSDTSLKISRAYRMELWEAMAGLNDKMTRQSFDENTGKVTGE